VQASTITAAARMRLLRVHQLGGMAGRSCFDWQEDRSRPPRSL
jgi:hypothetical protein